jgi:hypothetical protein
MSPSSDLQNVASNMLSLPKATTRFSCCLQPQDLHMLSRLALRFVVLVASPMLCSITQQHQESS